MVHAVEHYHSSISMNTQSFGALVQRSIAWLFTYFARECGCRQTACHWPASVEGPFVTTVGASLCISRERRERV